MRLTFAILLCSLAPVAHAAPSPTEAFVAKLSALPGCPTFSKLVPVFGPYKYLPKKEFSDNLKPTELAVGNLGKLGVTKITVHPVFDVYHFDPREDKDPMVGSIDIALDPKIDLAATIGAIANSTHFTSGSDTIWHAGSLYYKRGLLTYDCGGPPIWARQAWSDPDAKTATDRVIALLDHKTAAGLTKDPKEPGRTSFEDDRQRFGVQKDWWFVNFKTPLPAAAILKAIGSTRVVLRSTDVHRSSWTLHNADGSAIIYKDWRIDIDIVDDKLKKDNNSMPLDNDTLLITTINAHPK